MGNCFVASSFFLSPSSSSSFPPAAIDNNNLQSSASATAPVEVIRIHQSPKNVEELQAATEAGGGDDDDDDVHKTLAFTYEELRAATKNFRTDQIIGEGGFGIVYKGNIDETIRPGLQLSSQLVAVKVLNPEGFQGDREWLNEVNYLGQLSHPNLVKLIGYCCQGTHRLLVYEYMACGSLEKHLFRRVCLTMSWSTRMKIALGAAKGLAFLHGARRPIIYRDFKTSNILLDSDYNAKLSDFGLAKEGPMGDQTHVSTRVMGTYGYAAPEYVMTGHLTARSDVYGYGVVLLEMLIGKEAVDKHRPSREHNLVEWARPLLIHNKKLTKIVDPRIQGQYMSKSLQKVAGLAYQCLSQNPKGRPLMSQVVDILETLQEPHQPLSSSSMEDDSLLAAVTLYEAPRELIPSSSSAVPVTEEEEKKDRGETNGTENGGGRRRRRRRSGRSSSEPPKALQVFAPSPDTDLPH